MSMQACKDCGRQMSSRARACPQCGAPAPARTSFSTWVIGGLFALVVAVWVVGSVQAPETRAVAAKQTPEQRRKAAWAVDVARRVRQAAHDPASIEWVYAGVSPDGQVGCLTFRAKNGFGATVIDRVAVVKGAFERRPEAVALACGPEGRAVMQDMVGVVRYYR